MISLLKDESNRLVVMLGLSLLVHAVILTIKFAPEIQKKLQDTMPALEVVLVNSKSQSKPDKAEALAQASLNRGGNTEAKRRMKSPLPVPRNEPLETAAKPAPEAAQRAGEAARLQAEEVRKQQHVAELEKHAREMMTQIKSKQVVDDQSSQPVTAPTPEQSQQVATSKSLNAADLVARSLDAARMEAEISKDWDSYQQRPKRKFFGARVKEYRFAAYVESWRQKVEKVGNLNYPEEAKDRKLYGSLRMTVNIKADGTLESIELNQSSGHPVLDEAARRIVELAAPYAEFPPEVSKDTDILAITRTWTFTREDTLASQ